MIEKPDEKLSPPKFDSLSRDTYYWQQLDQLVAKRQYSLEDVLRNGTAYMMRRDLIRFMAYYELFRKVQNVAGAIVELGVYRGASFFCWANLLETFCPFDRHRNVFGFDSFEGLQDFQPEDGADLDGNVPRDELAMRYPGGWKATAWEFERLVEMHNADSMIPGYPRSRIVVGDIAETIPKFVKENPGFRISLVHFDVDLYEPTKVGLECLYPLVVPGGIVAFDEYACVAWPGESTAVDEYFASIGERPKLEKFSFAQAPTYIVKQ
jgi:hypothetical protein